jgi:hypothetical protein
MTRIRQQLAISVVITAVIQTGCATVIPKNELPSPAILQAADYGTVPASYKQKIKDYFYHGLHRLLHPDTAVYKLQEPQECYRVNERQKPAQYQQGHTAVYTFGQCVKVGLNAQNMFGQYLGERPYIFMFSKNGMDVTSDMNADILMVESNNPWK